MPRSSNPSNFTSDRHTLYAGWVAAMAKKHLGGDVVTLVADDNNDVTPYLDVTVTPGLTLRLMIPAPPEDWDLFADVPATLRAVAEEPAEAAP